MRLFLLMAVALAAAIPNMALAQPPNPPMVEVGAQVSRKVDFGALTWSPRITLNLAPLTAIEGTADIQRPNIEFGTRTTARAYSLHWRQALFTSGRWQVSGVLGAGTSRVEQDSPERIYQGRDGLEVVPAYTFVDTAPTVHLGPAVQFEAAPWLALRGDVRLTVGDNNGGLRGMVGAVVPIGRFRAGDRLTGPPSPLAAWQRVTPGRQVWVTTESGMLVHGEVASISDTSLRIRRQGGEVTLNVAEVRLVEGRDSLKNGFLIGGASGGIAGAALFTWAASVFCESDDRVTFEGAAALLGAASGIAVGGLLGAMVDSLIPGKRALFERSGTRVVPILSPQKKGIGVTIDWR